MKLLSDEKVISMLTQAFQDKPAGGLYPEEFRKAVSEMQEDIVRCKDCRWWNPFDRTCKNINYDEYMVAPAGFYCGWAERITDDDPSHPFADDVMMGERRTDERSD